MEDREIRRQRALVIGVLVAAVVFVGAFTAFAVAMCSNPDLQVRGAGQEQVQEIDARGAGLSSEEGESRVLAADEQEFLNFLASSVWVAALGESWVSFEGGEIVLHEGAEERRWEYELVSYEADAAESFDGAVNLGGAVACQTAVLTLDGFEETLTVEPYEPVWSYESDSYEGPVSGCYVHASFLDRAYYRVIGNGAAEMTVLPVDLMEAVFGEDLAGLTDALRTYCSENLPTVSELTYTGETVIDLETGVESHLFICKGAMNVFLKATQGDSGWKVAKM